MLPVRIRTERGARVPEYQSEGSAGADIFALVDEPVLIEPGDRALIPTGIYLEIPEGYEAQIRPRSGLALKHGITLPNSPGTIDSDYRGEVKIIVANMGSEAFTVSSHMRIAQMIFSRVFRAEFAEFDELETTARNDGGFGHSGM